MPNCQVCGNPLIEVIPGELYRCPVDGQYRRVRPKNESPLQAEVAAKPSSVAGEMKIFAERVIKALCPPEKGYAPVIVREVRTIYDVIEGRKDFTDWFARVRQALSLKNYEVAKVLYDCLDGLRTRDARELREQWYNYLTSEMKGYGLA